MAAVGVPIETIGRFLTPQIKNEATLKKHFALELEIGRMRADMEVMAVAFRMATSGHHEAMTWSWMTRRVSGFGDNELNPGGRSAVKMVRGDESAQ